VHVGFPERREAVFISRDRALQGVDGKRFNKKRGTGGWKMPKVKILAISDQVLPFIHSVERAKRFADVDLNVSGGDFSSTGLEYLVTQLNVTKVYVAGNHDLDQLDVSGRITPERGLWIMGLGGIRRYKPADRHQYSEAEMHSRAARLFPRLLINLPRAFKATLMLHGHMHVQQNLDTTCTRKYGTSIINVYPHTVETIETAS
jgi:predicted phosphodiesterase